jgi:hypothetical protein
MVSLPLLDCFLTYVLIVWKNEECFLVFVGRKQKQKKSFNLFEQNLKNEKTENFKVAKIDLK